MTPTQQRIKLLHAGHLPIPTNGKAVYIDAWSNLIPTEKDILEWEKTRPGDLGSGLLNERTGFIDNDVYVPDLAGAIEADIRSYLGGTILRRIGQAPKVAFPCRIEEPFRTFKTPVFNVRGSDGALLTHPNGKLIECAVEFRCAGSQTVAYGRHPETGKDYEWPDGDLWSVQYGSLPLLTEALARIICNAVTARLRAAPNLIEKGVRPDTKPHTNGARVYGATSNDLVDLDELRDALKYIDPTDRDTWRNVGMGIHDALGDPGRPIWDQWSQGCPSKYSDTEQNKAWRSFHPGGGITIATAFGYAKDRGWRCAPNGRDGASPAESKLPTIVSSGEFVADFVPPDYLVDGLIQEGFLYSLTGATGAGKTCITLRLAASVARGIVFASRETKKRRVLYLAAENPTDVRMRWIALAQQMDFLPKEIEVYFIEGGFSISENTERIKQEAARRGGEFGLVIVDTAPVFYEGDDENNRTQQGHHAELLRSLITLIPGKPAVIANCHPVKNAGPDNLLPAGGGNFLNQVDGNLTAAKTESTTALHHQGKYRGVDFAPMYFLIKTVTHQDLKDRKGRLIPTVSCEWISDRRQEELERQVDSDDLRILAHIAKFPRATLAEIATALDWKFHNGDPNKSGVQRATKRLIGERLLKKDKQGRWGLTKEGRETLDAED